MYIHTHIHTYICTYTHTCVWFHQSIQQSKMQNQNSVTFSALCSSLLCVLQYIQSTLQLTKRHTTQPCVLLIIIFDFDLHIWQVISAFISTIGRRCGVQLLVFFLQQTSAVLKKHVQQLGCLCSVNEQFYCLVDGSTSGRRNSCHRWHNSVRSYSGVGECVIATALGNYFMLRWPCILV